jgi:hypothetical protein
VTRAPLDIEPARQHLRKLRMQLVGITAGTLLLNLGAAAADVPPSVVWFGGFSLGVTATTAFIALRLR